ncbi:MAG: PAS domain S-box protein [Alphaproteobacteria bacterium]|nr:PAS domain S-box protein [Alphaproteobacteria bacterium]
MPEFASASPRPPAPPLWRDRFEAIAACTLQGQLVHRAFVPLWVNAAFADLFGYDAPEDALAAPSLDHLFDADARADCLALIRPDAAQRSAHGRFGRRLMRRRSGALFHAEIHIRRVRWDGDCALAVAVRELGAPPPPHAPGALFAAVSAPERAAIRRALSAPLDRIRFGPLAVFGADPAPQNVAVALVDIDRADAAAFVSLARRRANVPLIAVAAAPPSPAVLQALGADAFVEKSALTERLGDLLALLTRHAPPGLVDPPERREIEDEHEGDEPANDVDRDHV